MNRKQRRSQQDWLERRYKDVRIKIKKLEMEYVELHDKDPNHPHLAAIEKKMREGLDLSEQIAGKHGKLNELKQLLETPAEKDDTAASAT